MSDDSPKSSPPAASRTPRRVRLATRTFLVTCLLLFVWYVLADRLTPYTASGRVRAFVVPIVPEVSGYVDAIPVRNNQRVVGGEVLAQIQTQRFQFALDNAQAEFDLAVQQVGAAAEAVKSAAAQLAKARTDFEVFKVQSDRVIGLEGTGAVTQAQVDQVRADLRNKEAAVTAATAALDQAKQELGLEGPENARIRAALADVERARLDLTRATIRAPSEGFVTDLKIDEGFYAQAGRPLMTFISIDDVWVEAYFTENNLGNIEVGDRVEILFDMAPGRVFEGVIGSLGGGAASGRAAQIGDLPNVESARGWLRDPQRFPVIVDVPIKELDLGLRAGSQVDVVVYTGDRPILNALAALRIRIASLFSYVY